MNRDNGVDLYSGWSRPLLRFSPRQFVLDSNYLCWHRRTWRSSKGTKAKGKSRGTRSTSDNNERSPNL